jgi:hypothetical protein
MAARSSAKAEKWRQNGGEKIGGGSDNPAINFDNQSETPKRKIKMPSRKFEKGKANSVPELIAETLGRNKEQSLVIWNLAGRVENIVRKHSKFLQC